MLDLDDAGPAASKNEKSMPISSFPPEVGRLKALARPRNAADDAGWATRRAFLATPLAAALPLQAGRADELGGALRGVLERRRLRILVSLGVPPFGYRDSAGEPAGFDVAIGRLLADGLGVTANFHDVLPGERLARLRAGEADVAMNVALSVENARQVLLTTPVSRADIMLAASVTHMLRRPADLEGHPVGVLGGAGLEGAVAETLPPSVRVVIFESRAALASAVESRLVHAVVLRRPVMQRFLLDFSRLGLTHRFVLTRRWTSVGVRFGEHDLLRALNSLIFMAGTGGRISELAEAFLGMPQPDLPSF